MAYKHIGVAISGNEEDALLVNKALELARHNDAHLTLIHIDDGLSELYPVCLLWPTAAVTVKRLHDRGRSGAWAFLMIVAWMLLAGNWAILPGVWQWAVGRFVPTLILVMMLIDLGAFVGTQGENKYGKDTQDVKYKADNKSSN